MLSSYFCISCAYALRSILLHVLTFDRIMDPQSRAQKKSTSHANEMLPHYTTHLIKRPCYQRGSPCQDPAGNRTTQRPPDERKEMQTALVWSRSLGLAKTILQGTAKGGRRQGRLGKRRGDNIGEWTGLEETVCEIMWCSNTTLLAVKG